MIIFLVGCGNAKNTQNTAATQAAKTNDITDKSTEKPTVKATEKPTEKPTEEPSFDIDWTEVSFSEKGGEGYTYDVTVKLSPWILLSNHDIVSSAWSEVSNGNPLPEFKDWKLELYDKNHNIYTKKVQNGIYQYYGHSMTDMYYCLGEVRINNTTDGWSINENNPHPMNIYLFWECKYDDPYGASSASTICRAYYSNGYKETGGELSAGISTQNSAVIPIILMAPEKYTPERPDGQYYENIRDGSFVKQSLSKKDFKYTKVGIIGKDRKYVEPEE